MNVYKFEMLHCFVCVCEILSSLDLVLGMKITLKMDKKLDD